MLFSSHMPLPMVTPTTSYKFNVGKVHVFKKVFKHLSGLLLIKILGSNILMTERIVQKTKIFVQAIMYNKKLHKNYVSIRTCIYENLQTISQMPVPPDRDWLVEEQKRYSPFD